MPLLGAGFVLESLVTAALGVVTGAVPVVLLSYNLIMGGSIDEAAEFERFIIPWSNMAFFIAAALAAAVIMTWWPARKASDLPIAEALRYE